MRILPIVLLLLLASTAFAQDVRLYNCRTYEAAKEELLAAHDEVPLIIALSDRGQMIVFLGDEGDGSWTVLSVRPNQCVSSLDFGKHFEVINPGDEPPI